METRILKMCFNKFSTEFPRIIQYEFFIQFGNFKFDLCSRVVLTMLVTRISSLSCRKNYAFFYGTIYKEFCIVQVKTIIYWLPTFPRDKMS